MEKWRDGSVAYHLAYTCRALIVPPVNASAATPVTLEPADASALSDSGQVVPVKGVRRGGTAGPHGGFGEGDLAPGGPAN